MAKPASGLVKSANALGTWFDQRLPISTFWRDHMSGYYAPKNFNFWYFFGSLALLVLVNQILTGIFLTMHYKPSAAEAFASVEYIMRDVDYGWLIRYMHSTGASAFFIVIYLHMFRGLLYGSYRKPRELIWIFGMLIYLLLMAEAFMGYVLPWGNMSYWGAQVIVSLFGAIPEIGPWLTEWIRGDYFISDATLNRFFALHVIALPFALAGLVVLHIAALHEVGSNNPDGIEIKGKGMADPNQSEPRFNTMDLALTLGFVALFAFMMFVDHGIAGFYLAPLVALAICTFLGAKAQNVFTHKNPNVVVDGKPVDGIPFHPYYTVKDIFGVAMFLLLFAFIIFYAPTMGGLFLEHDNFVPANLLATPEHIKPVWYFTPFYAMLRAVPDKLGGVILMGLAIVALFLLPWLDRARVRSVRYKGMASKLLIAVFAVAFVRLGMLGMGEGTPAQTIESQFWTFIYFSFFIVLWFISRYDPSKPVPERVTH